MYIFSALNNLSNKNKENVCKSLSNFQSKDIKKSSEMSAKDEKKAVDLGLLDEDDEFEEFPAEGNCRLAFSKYLLPMEKLLAI